MKKHELIWATSSKSESGGDLIPTGENFIILPTKVENSLESLLEPHDQHPGWFFTKIENSCADSPWAFVCFDREYSIAGHFTTCNPKNSGILFAPYSNPPDPIPQNFVPKVGVVVVQKKKGLETAKSSSLLFQQLWDYLKDCDSTRPWLIVADPLPNEWLDQIMPKDSELWLSSR
jgi:hypothetical protein